MLCPSCNKFASMSTDTEPEVDVTLDGVDLESQDDQPNKDAGTARIAGTVRIVLTSECCGDELKEANFDVDCEIDVERAEGCTCDLESDLELDDTSAELTDRSETFTTRIAKRGPDAGKEVKKPIPYRYQKRFYGASLEISVKCKCGKTEGNTTWEDECQASGMDELT